MGGQVMPRSKQEDVVTTLYPYLKYEPCKFEYVRRYTYTPDLYLGVSKLTGKHVYVEMKEWVLAEDLPKYEAIYAYLPPNTELRFLCHKIGANCLRRLSEIFTVRVEQYYLDDWVSECDRSQPYEPPKPKQHTLPPKKDGRNHTR